MIPKHDSGLAIGRKGGKEDGSDCRIDAGGALLREKQARTSELRDLRGEKTTRIRKEEYQLRASLV